MTPDRTGAFHPARARKRFGQHFLEPAWVARVIAAIAPQPTDAFVEIGPGRGALTRPLAAAARDVVAIEIDRDLAAALDAAALANVHVVEGDVLGIAGFPAGGPLRIAGNLPYNVASPILIKLVDLFVAGTPLVDATLMLQREVADRLLAAPASRDYGTLTVLVTQWADVTRLLNLPPGAFRPPPKVDSSLVRLRFRRPHAAVRDLSHFRRVVQTTFTHRRKTLANALKPLADPSIAECALLEARLDGRRRPETLSVDEFTRLADKLQLCYSKCR
jgi:16S rRNA (adenine1518-N6/adenine1519-N6)-dimethyltransferase